MRCPSQDWDRHVEELDAAADAEMAWWELHGDRVLQVMCAWIASGDISPRRLDDNARKKAVECAQKLVDDIVTMKGGY